MKLPDELTAEQHAALVEVIKVFARRGRQLREARERAQKENRRDVRTVGDSQNNSATMKETLHEGFDHK